MPLVGSVVLVVVSSTCSVSSGFTISSVSTTCPGESDSDVSFLFTGKKRLTGKNMVLHHVVLSGLPEEGLYSNFPLCFMC